jgi:hypothetical protein
MTSEDKDRSGFERHKKSRLGSKTIDILLVLLVLMLGLFAFLLFFPKH